MPNISPMKILVFGATGPTGQQIVRRALQRELAVVAFVRDPKKLALRHPLLSVVQGDILDPVSIDTAMASSPDAVISALGIYHRRPSTQLSAGTGNIVSAMEAHGVDRIVIVSSLGAGDSRGQGSLVARMIQWLLLRHVLDDKTRQEDVLRQSSLAWTSFRPPQLTMADPSQGDIVLWTGAEPSRKLSWKLSRATLASYVLDAIEANTHLRAAVNLSEPV